MSTSYGKRFSLARILRDKPVNVVAEIKRLPPQAAAKYCELDAECAAVRAEQAALDEKRNEAIAFRREQLAESGRFHLEGENGVAHNASDIADEKQRRANIAEVTAEIQAMNEAKLSSTPTPDYLDEFFVANRGKMFRYKALSPFKGTVSIEALEAIRTKDIGGTQREIQRVLAAPLTQDEIDARIEREVDRWARRGETKIEKTTRTFRGYNGYEQGRPNWSGNPERSDITSERGLAIIFNILRDEIVSNLKVKVRANYDYKAAIPMKDRAKRIAQLDARLLEFQRTEESLIVALKNAGIAVDRRPNANPLAILGIEVDPNAKPLKPPDAAETRGSLQVVQANDPKERSKDFDFG